MKLCRLSQGDDGTFGILFNADEKQIAVTCERPDNGNQKMGRIPAGIYHVTPFLSPTKGHVFLLHDVPGRDMIEIHAGNTIADTEGCILVGATLGYIHGVKAVVYSRPTLAKILADYPGPFDLTITEHMP